jgi:hypothetical protein
MLIDCSSMFRWADETAGRGTHRYRVLGDTDSRTLTFTVWDIV